MQAAAKRTYRQSDAAYSALRVISHQMPPRGRVELGRIKHNLPEESRQQYESLNDEPSNQGLNNQFLFGPYSRKLEHLIQDS